MFDLFEGSTVFCAFGRSRSLIAAVFLVPAGLQASTADEACFVGLFVTHMSERRFSLVPVLLEHLL